MQEEKTSVFSNSLIWFGAAVSIAEILTGTFLAPLGLWKGIAAAVTGHLIGGVLMLLAGLIGGKTGLGSMDTVKLSFGTRGSVLFSGLNVLQLVGWTAVMILSGAAAAQSILPLPGAWCWSIIIGALIAVWILIGLKNLGKVNTAAMAALFVLTIILSVVVFRNGAPAASSESMSFGAAVELSVAMPLSWLPLISDYTRSAGKYKAATAASCAVYFVVSCWMYIIGLGAAVLTGESDVAAIMLKAGLGAAGLIIVVFSTVTTTFLDVYSSGVSCRSISEKLREKPSALIVCAVGTLLAVITDVSRFEDFLYLIGSVFAPMTAILIADFFILHRRRDDRAFCIDNLIIWLIGFGLYRVFMRFDIPCGYTLPVMLITAAICVLTGKILKGGRRC